MARSVYYDDELREAVCDWLRANDVDPRTLPADPHPSMAEGRLTLQQKVQKDGRDVIRQAEVLRRTITVPVKVPPPAVIQEWLEPRCPTCGR